MLWVMKDGYDFKNSQLYKELIMRIKRIFKKALFPNKKKFLFSGKISNKKVKLGYKEYNFNLVKSKCSF